MLYQVEQRGRQTAFVGEDGAGLVGLYPLLARAAAIAENENSSFAEALSLAAAERGTPLRRVFADEAEALSHDLGHGGAAEQRAVIDLDNGRIRLEYDHRAGSLRESLDALANHFPTAGANRIQNRLIAFLAEHDGSEELYKTLHNELGLTNQEIEAMGFDLAHRYEPDCDDAYQDIVDYICLVCSDGHEFEFFYPLTSAEQVQLWNQMDAYCHQQNGQSLGETRTALLREQAEEGLEIRL